MPETSTASNILLYVLLFIALLIAVPMIAVTSRTLAERLVAVILALTLFFYYTSDEQSFVRLLPGSDGEIATRILGWLEQYHSFVLHHLPNTNGIQLFDHRLFGIQIDYYYSATYWPLVILLVGVTIRLVIGKYVRNVRMKQIAREYWLFITTYVILAKIISDITHVSFVLMIILALLLIFLLTAGIFRVGVDLLDMAIGILGILGRLIRIIMKYVALYASKFVKVLQTLIRRIRQFYETYVVQPIRRVHAAIQVGLDKAEKKVEDDLKRL